MMSSVLTFVLRMSAGVVLFWAGGEKLKDVRSFEVAVASYRLLPRLLVRPVSWLLPLIEVLLGVSLISGLFLPMTAAGGAVLFALFGTALAINLTRHNLARCHCFGAENLERISLVAVVRAFLLMAFAIYTAILAPEHVGVPTGARGAASLTIAAGLVALLRLAGWLPIAWSFLSSGLPSTRPRARKVSFKHQPLTTSLLGSPSLPSLKQALRDPSYHSNLERMP